MKNCLSHFVIIFLVLGTLTVSHSSFAEDEINAIQQPSPFVNLNKEFGYDWKSIFGQNEVGQSEDVGLKDKMSVVIFRELFLLLKPKLIPERSFVATNLQVFDDVLPSIPEDTSPENGEHFIPLPVDVAILPYTYSGNSLLICMTRNSLYVTMPEKHDLHHLDIGTAKLYAERMAERLFVIDITKEKYEFALNGNQAILKTKSEPSDVISQSRITFNFSQSFISCRYDLYPGIWNLGKEGGWFENTVGHFSNVDSSRFVSNWDIQNDNQYKLLLEEINTHYSTQVEFTHPHLAAGKEELAAAEQLKLSLKYVLDPKLITDEDKFLSNVQVKSILQDKQLRYIATYKVEMGKFKLLPVAFSNDENEIKMAIMLGQGYNYDSKKGYVFEDDDLVKSAFMWILNNYFRWTPSEKDISVVRPENDDKIYIHVAEHNDQPYRIKEAVFFKHGQYIVLDNIGLN